jgi:hypothetical protein
MAPSSNPPTLDTAAAHSVALIKSEFRDEPSLHLPAEATRILSEINGPESWICIVGPARSGKSFLADLLYGREGTFTADNGGPCTEGVDMSPESVEHLGFAARFETRGNRRAAPIRFLDVEGQNHCALV